MQQDSFDKINIFTIDKCNVETEKQQNDAVFFVEGCLGGWFTAAEMVAKFPRYTRKLKY